MIGISIHSTLAASWLICNGCISNVSREWRAIFPSQRPWNRICHLPFSVYSSLVPRVMKTEAVREGEGEGGGVSVNEFTLSMFECLSPGCGSADRQGVMGRGSPKAMQIRSLAE